MAADVAAKGLDFPDIQHVINFDMPREIENYVHRIGRTGRCGKTGVATTFINKLVDEHILLDLKHLLIEAKQRVPPVLMALEDPDDLGTNGACPRPRPRPRALAVASTNRHRHAHHPSLLPPAAEAELGKGCAYCGGLGHRITNCPKLEHQRKQLAGPRKDFLAGKGADW